LPVIESLAKEYGNRIAFVAVAWKGTPEATAERAAELIPSGAVAWGLDADEQIFALYGVPYQPATVLIDSGKKIFNRWPGVMTEDETRAAIETLLQAEG
jgi:hypothetical protein